MTTNLKDIMVNLTRISLEGLGFNFLQKIMVVPNAFYIKTRDLHLELDDFFVEFLIMFNNLLNNLGTVPSTILGLR